MVQNALTIYQKMPDPLAAIQSLGRDIAVSRVMGEITVGMGNVLAMECLSRGIPPLTLAEKYNVIFGKLSMKAEAMIGEFHERGGKSRILRRDADGVSIELEYDGNKQTFSLTWEEAQCESFPYEIKKGTTEDQVIEKILAWKAGARGARQPELKTKYKTPRSRTQMLWARLVSDAVRAMMPEVNSGRYTPEEYDAGGDDEPQAGGDGQVVDAEFEVKPEATASKPAEKSAEPNGNGQHTEKPIETATDPLAGAVPAMQGTISDEKGDSCLCTPEQVTSIKAAMGELGMSTEQRQNALAKRNVKTFMELSYAQATELLGILRGKIDQRRTAVLDAANGRTAGTPAVETPAPQPRHDDGTLCSDVQVASVKQLLIEINQVSPGFAEKFKEKLRASGRQAVKELTAVECDALIEQLKLKNLEKFFADQLKPKPKPEDGDEAAGAVAKN
jgi:hypothetical protein